MRNSNFELLRIFAICGIVLHHLVINVIDVCGYNTDFDGEKYNGGGYIGIIINSFTVYGVNLFILISGWFGIKSNYKKIIWLIVDTAFFGLIALFIASYFSPYKFNVHNILSTISITKYWFILHYIILMLVAPIIERVLFNIDEKTLRRYLIILTIVNIFFGWILQTVNTNGLNYNNFIYIYIIGRYLKVLQNTNNEIYNKISKYALNIFIMTIISEVILYIITDIMGHHPKSLRFWEYNSPWVIISSMCVFIYFSKKNIQSKTINLIAKGVLGAYLIHTNSFITPTRNQIAIEIFERYNYLGILSYSLCITIVCIFLSLIYILLKDQLLRSLKK